MWFQVKVTSVEPHLRYGYRDGQFVYAEKFENGNGEDRYRVYPGSGAAVRVLTEEAAKESLEAVRSRADGRVKYVSDKQDDELSRRFSWEWNR